LQGKLTLGVQEARETIAGGTEQIRQAQEHIDKARRAYELSNDRLNLRVPGSTHSEVLLSLQGLGLAQANYLNVLREYNKAQVRLMVLLGGGAKKEDRR
jgi:outer membrane protein TolC